MTKQLQTRVETRPDGACLYTLSGNLFGSAEGYAFQDEVRRTIAGGARGIVIDVSGVSRIDSSGVGILVAIMWSASNAKTRMVLTALPQRVEKVLSLAMLLEHIDHAPTLDEALAKLRP
jgi:anti-anti-sigma factor